MQTAKILAFVLMIAFGVFLIVFGERDDSPGAQGLGLIIAIFGLVRIFKSRKKPEDLLH